MKLTKVLSIGLLLLGLVLLVWGIALWVEVRSSTTEGETEVAVLSQPMSTTNAKIFVAIGLTFCLNVLFVWKRLRLAASEKEGFPADDEFSRQLKYRASHWAFHQSFFVWIVIFLLRDSFDKAETMLGLGMLTMAALYGLNILVFKGRGMVDEDQG
jgi:hypothetical protein